MARLKENFYTQDVLTVAPALLGKLLCRRDKASGEVIKLRIVETEAYRGEEDTACHASKSGKTPRTSVLYGRGGHVYVYLCYGIHYLLNIVAGEENFPQGALIRGVEGYIGPGRVTKRLAVDKTLYGINLSTSDEIWVEDDGFIAEKIETSPRVGIDYACDEYRLKPWRFRISL